MLVSKNVKFAFPPTPNLKFALPPTQTPNTSQWNIGCVGSPKQNFRVGHVYFMLFVLISFALVTEREPSLQWSLGYRVSLCSCPSIVDTTTFITIATVYRSCRYV